MAATLGAIQVFPQKSCRTDTQGGPQRSALVLCTMTNVWSLPGLLTALLLVICSSAYARKVPTLRRLLLSEKTAYRELSQVLGHRDPIALAGQRELHACLQLFLHR